MSSSRRIETQPKFYTFQDEVHYIPSISRKLFVQVRGVIPVKNRILKNGRSGTICGRIRIKRFAVEIPYKKLDADCLSVMLVQHLHLHTVCKLTQYGLTTFYKIKKNTIVFSLKFMLLLLIWSCCSLWHGFAAACSLGLCVWITPRQ